ncbi:MAG TPA: amidohydrolase family protein, partial [Desulfobacteria bacterium]|nr:amidohydrolase family protein [Desulfobacteria bacterium]
LEAGCSSIEHGFFMGKENLALMADSRVFWVPTACTMKAYGKYAGESGGEGRMALRNLEHQLEQIATAKAFGVPIALGTDSGSMGVCHGSALVDELGLFLDAGFSIEEAIQCASLNTATLMGLDGRGIVKKGMRADFVVAKGHPSELPEGLKSVSKIHVGDRFL